MGFAVDLERGIFLTENQAREVLGVTENYGLKTVRAIYQNKVEALLVNLDEFPDDQDVYEQDKLVLDMAYDLLRKTLQVYEKNQRIDKLVADMENAMLRDRAENSLENLNVFLAYSGSRNVLWSLWRRYVFIPHRVISLAEETFVLGDKLGREFMIKFSEESFSVVEVA